MSPQTAPALFGPLRGRSYLFRLPLFTRSILLFMVSVALISLQTLWDIRAWAALVPSKTSLTSAYRITTFSFVHGSLAQLVFDVIALTSLLERFESAHGTLMTTALFFGPLTSMPAVLYLLLGGFILRLDGAVMGASVWVFLLCGVESMRLFRLDPTILVGTIKIPTWSPPLIMLVIVALLLPNTSIVAHLCGLAVGYLYGLGYLTILNPPERLLRWIESRLNLLARLPHYVSVDQKTYGRFGLLPTVGPSG